MLNQIFRIFYSRATGSNLWWLALFFGLFAGWVMPWAGAELMAFSKGTKPLDLRFFYSPDEAYTLLKDLGGQGRLFYTMVELTADILFPLTYTLLLCCLIVYLGKQVPFRRATTRTLLLLPLLTLLFDYAENACILSLLIHYPYRQEGVAWAGAFFTGMKWLFLFASAGIALFAALAAARARIFSPPNVNANQAKVPPVV
jgi:hypothetical protein